MLAAPLDNAQQVTYALAPDAKDGCRLAWAVALNGRDLATGDGAAVEGESMLTIAAKSDGTEILLFDLR